MKNTLVHCLSLPNIIEKDFFLINLPLMCSSNLSLSKNNRLILFCDKGSKEIVDELGLVYDEIIVGAEKNRSVLTCLDAMKYFKDEKKMIYADIDVISDKDFSSLEYDIITQGIEFNNGWNLINYHSFRKRYVDFIDDYYYNASDNNLFAYNCGFVGFNDLEFKKLYIENWEKHIEANLKYNEWLQYDIIFGTHVEQVQLYSLIKGYDKKLNVFEVQKIKNEVSTFKDMFEIMKHDYFHPHGRYKYDDRIKRDILKYLSIFGGSSYIKKINQIANDYSVNGIMKL